MPAIPNIRPDPLLPQYFWSERTGRYADRATGRFVSAVKVREQLDLALDASTERMVRLSDNLRNGRISLDEWFLGVAKEVKTVHLTSGALEKGGWAQLSQSDFGRIGAQVKKEYGFLRSFAQDIASGKQKLDGTLLSRTRLYGQAGRTTYHRLEQADERLRGKTEERRVLGRADHCSDCIGYALREWQPIGTLPPPGEGSACRTNCHCSMEFR